MSTPDKKLAVFDFDGTLFRSPDRTTGELAYKRATGSLWPHRGWWGRTESLDPPVVPAEPDGSWFLPEVLAAHGRHLADPHSHVVLMTGRHRGFEPRVRHILDHAGALFHETLFRDDRADTLRYKASMIEAMAPDRFSSVEIYEDRPDHVRAFADLLRRLRRQCPQLLTAVVHDVVTKRDHAA